MIRILLDQDAVKMAESLFADKKSVRICASRAINRANSAVQKNVSKAIRENYTVSAKAVKRGFKLSRSNSNKLVGAVISKGSPVPLHSFQMKPTLSGMIAAAREGIRITKPIQVQVEKQAGWTRLDGLFIQKSSRSNYTGPMHRYLRSAYPLRIPYGPSVPQMFGSEKTLEELAPLAEDVLNKRFLHEVRIRYEKGLK